MKRRIFLITVCAIAVVFAAANILWYFTAYRPYAKFEKACREALPDWQSDSHARCGNDADQYSYSVKYPGYMSWTGNLAIGSPNPLLPNGEEIPYSDALIIWPESIFSPEERGVILYEYEFGEDAVSCAQSQIYVDRNGSLVPMSDGYDDENQKILDAHADSVRELTNRAADMWFAE